MKNQFSFYILFSLLVFNSYGQTEIKDSLIQVLQSNKNQDTARVSTLIALGALFVNSETDTSILILNEAKAIADKLHYLKGQTEYCIYMSAINSEKNTSEQINTITQKGIQYAMQYGDKILLGRTMNQRGNYFKLISNHDSAVYYYLNAKNLFEDVKNYQKLAVALTNLSNEYYVLKNYEKAEVTGQQALEYAKKYNQNLVCAVLGKLGNICMDKHDYKKAEQYYKQSIEEGTKANNIYNNLGIMSNLAECYSYQKKYTEMLRLAEKTYALAVEFKSPENTQYALKSLADAQYLNLQFEQAKATVQQEMNYSIEQKISTDFHEEYILLADIAIAQHNFSAADSLRAIGDSIQQLYVNDQIRNSTMELETKYETQKKQSKIVLLQKQNQSRNFWIYGLLASLLAILFIGFFVYRFMNQQKKIVEQESIKLKQEKIISATNAMLQGEETERTRLARDLHDGLGGLLSGIKFQLNTMKGNVILNENDALTFTSSISQLDNAIAEMRRVAHNMMPEVLVNFGLDEALKSYCENITQSKALKINYQSFGVENRLEKSTEIVVYRIVQELLNNIVKHAQATESTIQLSRNNNLVSLTVEDNGKGFDTINLNQTKGIGLQNLQNRVDYLNGTLDIKSDNKGTSAHIEFEIKS